MRTLVMGDVHGAHRALEQALERCGFRPDEDRLIFLGDAVDGWPESREVLDALCAVPDLVYVLGNHDEWFLMWVRGEWRSEWDMSLWTQQGGTATLASYACGPDDVSEAHVRLLEDAVRWHVEDGRLFVHGGWRWRVFDHPRQDEQDNLSWDRELWEAALGRQRAHDAVSRGNPGVGPLSPLTRWREVFVGHTATSRYSTEPVRAGEVWNLDQGCGWAGRLSVMDVATKEYWQSDPVRDLYPEYEGRR